MHLRDEIANAARSGSRVGVGGRWIHSGAKVDPSVILFPNCYIGPNVIIGADCVVGPGATIGAPGFGYDHEEDGSWTYRTHTAGVVIEDNVHIGAGANVAQGRWRPTTIKTGARIDAHVHIAHNCLIGRNVAIAASSMLAGSVTVGDGAYIAPGASVRDNRTVGEGATVGLGAAVVCDVPANETWAGVPARRMSP